MEETASVSQLVYSPGGLYRGHAVAEKGDGGVHVYTARTSSCLAKLTLIEKQSFPGISANSLWSNRIITAY